MTAFPAPMTPSTARQTPSRRVLLADPEAASRAPLLRHLADLPSISVTTVETRPELESRLQSGDVDLVIATARLGKDSALEVLARMRALGDRTPFLVYSQLHATLMRVLLSDARSTLLSSRVMHLADLMEMVGSLSAPRLGATG